MTVHELQPRVGNVRTHESIPVPTTTGELHTAINSLYKNMGKYDRAFIMAGDARIQFNSYLSTPPGQHTDVSSNAVHPTEAKAIACLWDRMVVIRTDPMSLWTDEMKEDFKGSEIIPATRVWWRAYPEVVETSTGCYSARLRAAFTG